jgi:hypothetical protein
MAEFLNLYEAILSRFMYLLFCELPSSATGTKLTWVEKFKSLFYTDVYGVTLSVHPHRVGWNVCLTTVGIEPATFAGY